MSATIPRPRTCRVDMFTLTENWAVSGSSDFQSAVWRHASTSTQRPISTMRPVSSASGMNSAGWRKPRFGCRQRASASTPITFADSTNASALTRTTSDLMTRKYCGTKTTVMDTAAARMPLHIFDCPWLMTIAATMAARNQRATHTEGRSPAELKELVRHVGAELELAPAEVIVEWAAATFGGRFCVTSSMGDAVLAHIAAKVAPGVDVVFLDTGYHFAETIGTRDAVAATLDVNLINITPVQSVAEQDAEFGEKLFERDPDLCCKLRKVVPLEQTLASYDAWATGLRRDETHNRVVAPVVGWDDKRQMVKVSPLARWTGDDVDRYIDDNGVLVNPLQYDGYPSIGCWPCTRRVEPGEDARAGRWSGTGKTECGIH